MYVKAAGSTVLVYPYSKQDLMLDNPQTSFPPVITDELLAHYGVYPVVDRPNPPYDPATQYVATMNKPIYLEEEKIWAVNKVVVDMTPEQIKAREDRLKGDNKRKAEALLTETDWVELGDVSDPANPPYLTNRADFTAYRAALRAIAVNPPVVAEFPVKPEEVWS